MCIICRPPKSRETISLRHLTGSPAEDIATVWLLNGNRLKVSPDLVVCTLQYANFNIIRFFYIFCTFHARKEEQRICKHILAVH